MRTLLLILLIASPLAAKSQYFGGSFSYLYHQPTNFDWAQYHGFQFGLGGENFKIGESPFTFSARNSLMFNLKHEGDRLENVEFDLPDSIPNMGYADISFKRFTMGMEFDFGYRQWEYSILEPYTTIGVRLSSNTSQVQYELYPAEGDDPCYCNEDDPEQVSVTKSLGLSMGAGLKVHITKGILFDFRATHYSTWGSSSNEYFGAPDRNSFHIDPYGTPTFDYRNGNYFSGFEFRAGIIFKLDFGGGAATGWYYSSGGSSDSSDDSSDDSDDSSSNESSSGSSGSGCSGVSLSPKGRGD